MNQNEKQKHDEITAETASQDEKRELAISLLPEIKKLLSNQLETPPLLGDWVSEGQVEKLLGKKKTSLYYLRKAGKLIATTTRPVFYSLASIKQYLESTVKTISLKK